MLFKKGDTMDKIFKHYHFMFILGTFILLLMSCQTEVQDCSTVVKPTIVTDTVKWDTDDPAIWINPEDASQSLILGTDKDQDGALYVFNLEGKVIEEKTVHNIKRPNNVDVEYGLSLNGEKVDIAVTTERFENRLRVFSLPDMKEIDNGGIQAEGLVAPMGISLYKRPSDGAIFAIVSPKEGSTENYLWQFLLKDDGNGNVTAEKVRQFGNFSGIKEIESIAVDDPLGYVYYSDEQYGVRKYYADPDMPDADKELGMIDTKDYWEDNEGISIYPTGDETGYILVSDQSANRFRIYAREGTPAVVDPEDPEDNMPARPHLHKLIKIIDVSTNNSDGSEATNVNLGPNFPNGIFVAMSDNKTFQIYDWNDIIKGKILDTKNWGK